MSKCKTYDQELMEGQNYCQNCGNNVSAKDGDLQKHTGFGITAFVLGLISVITFWFPLSDAPFALFLFLTVPLSVVSIIFGVMSYWGKQKDKLGLAGFFCGLIALVMGSMIFILAFLSA